jgi:hypothetical protein
MDLEVIRGMGQVGLKLGTGDSEWIGMVAIQCVTGNLLLHGGLSIELGAQSADALDNCTWLTLEVSKVQAESLVG